MAVKMTLNLGHRHILPVYPALTFSPPLQPVARQPGGAAGGARARACRAARL